MVSTASLSSTRPTAQALRCNTAEIVNMALYIFENDDLGAVNHSFDSFSLDCSTPPLDTVTTCSSDDSDSISSISSAESGPSSPASPRSIFKTYWEKEGGAPALKPRTVRSSLLLASCNRIVADNSSTNTYERLLKVKEEISPPPLRRAIFGQGCYSKSQPQLDLPSLAPSTFRKTTSASALDHPKKSCLRDGRFSGRLCRRRSEESVSFRPDVDVVVFSPPVEQFAAEGWSKLFAN